MNTPIDVLLRSVAPVTDDSVRVMSLDGADDELRAAILEQADDVKRSESARSRRQLFTGRTQLRIAGGLSVVAIVSTLVFMLSGGGVGPARIDDAWAAADVQLADSVPRIAIDEPGWQIKRADELSDTEGEVTFAKGSRSADLFWRPLATYESYVADRSHASMELENTDVLGNKARAFRYRHFAESALPVDADSYTALWHTDQNTVEFRTMVTGSTVAARDARFLEMLRKLRHISVDDWLSAMPASVILPSETALTVQTMLADIPQPSGFDPQPLISNLATRDRYQLSAKVVGSVACAWIAQWIDAGKIGDTAGAQAAVKAMDNTDHWGAVKFMNRHGDYGYFLAEYGKAMANGDVLPESNGELTISGTYKAALGCNQNK